MVKDLYIEHLNRLNARVAVLKRRNPIFLTLELLSLMFFEILKYTLQLKSPIFWLVAILNSTPLLLTLPIFSRRVLYPVCLS